jgi:hypothetical protein
MDHTESIYKIKPDFTKRVYNFDGKIGAGRTVAVKSMQTRLVYIYMYVCENLFCTSRIPSPSQTL